MGSYVTDMPGAPSYLLQRRELGVDVPDTDSDAGSFPVSRSPSAGNSSPRAGNSSQSAGNSSPSAGECLSAAGDSQSVSEVGDGYLDSDETVASTPLL